LLVRQDELVLTIQSVVPKIQSIVFKIPVLLVLRRRRLYGLSLRSPCCRRRRTAQARKRVVIDGHFGTSPDDGDADPSIDYLRCAGASTQCMAWRLADRRTRSSGGTGNAKKWLWGDGMLGEAHAQFDKTKGDEVSNETLRINRVTVAARVCGGLCP